MTTSHEFGKHIIKLTEKMHEHLWSQCYLLISGQAHCERKKVLFLSRSLITARISSIITAA